MPNVVDVREEIAEIKKIIIELYKCPIIVEPVVETVIPIVKVLNIWVISVNVQDEDIDEQKREKERKKKRIELIRKKIDSRALRMRLIGRRESRRWLSELVG